MAKVKGPLMSMDASGSLGGAIVFSKWKGRNYVRQHVTPSNPQSNLQRTYRSSMAGLVKLYQSNRDAINIAFAGRAGAGSQSPFNAFTGFNQSRLRQGAYAADSPSPSEAAPANNAAALAALVNGAYVALTWTDALDPDAWAFAIFRAVGAAPTGALSELEALVPRGVQVYNEGPLEVGDYRYSIRAVSRNGGVTALAAAVAASVGGGVGVPAAPANLVATGSMGGQNNLNWDDVVAADFYRVLRTDDPSVPFAQIADNVVASAYLDSGAGPGIQRFYVVRAVNGAGESANSNMDDAMASP